MTHISTAVYVDGRRVAEGLKPAEAVERARTHGGFAWIGLRESADLADLDGVVNLHPLAVQEAERGHERSKLIRFDDGIFLALQPARYHDDTESVECHEVDVFAGKHYIVTVDDPDNIIDTDSVRGQLEEHPDVLTRGPFAVLWGLLEQVTRGYRAVLEGVENDIDEIEDQLFAPVPDPDVSHRIFSLQRQVIDLQHAVAPLPELLVRLEEDVRAKAPGAAIPAIREVRDRATSTAARVEAFRRTLDNALTVHSSMMDQRRNEEMRQMTEFGLQQNDQVKKISSWAAILFAPTLVGTVYGMNFDNMPELAFVWGYPAALGLMLATSITLYLVFKKRDWL